MKGIPQDSNSHVKTPPGGAPSSSTSEEISFGETIIGPIVDDSDPAATANFVKAPLSKPEIKEIHANPISSSVENSDSLLVDKTNMMPTAMNDEHMKNWLDFLREFSNLEAYTATSDSKYDFNSLIEVLEDSSKASLHDDLITALKLVLETSLINTYNKSTGSNESLFFGTILKGEDLKRVKETIGDSLAIDPDGSDVNSNGESYISDRRDFIDYLSDSFSDLFPLLNKNIPKVLKLALQAEDDVLGASKIGTRINDEISTLMFNLKTRLRLFQDKSQTKDYLKSIAKLSEHLPMVIASHFKQQILKEKLSVGIVNNDMTDKIAPGLKTLVQQRVEKLLGEQKLNPNEDFLLRNFIQGMSDFLIPWQYAEETSANTLKDEALVETHKERILELTDHTFNTMLAKEPSARFDFLPGIYSKWIEAPAYMMALFPSVFFGYKLTSDYTVPKPVDLASSYGDLDPTQNTVIPEPILNNPSAAFNAFSKGTISPVTESNLTQDPVSLAPVIDNDPPVEAVVPDVLKLAANYPESILNKKFPLDKLVKLSFTSIDNQPYLNRFVKNMDYVFHEIIKMPLDVNPDVFVIDSFSELMALKNRQEIDKYFSDRRIKVNAQVVGALNNRIRKIEMKQSKFKHGALPVRQKSGKLIFMISLEEILKMNPSLEKDQLKKAKII